MKLHGKYKKVIHLEDVIDSLIRRIESLLYFHHNRNLVNDEWKEKWLEKVRDCHEKEAIFHNVVYDRFSTRQKQKMYIDGIEGQLF